MGVKISLISESISIMVIDLFKFDSGFSSGRLLIPVSRSSFIFALRFFHFCTSVIDVKVVNFRCMMLYFVYYSQRVCVLLQFVGIVVLYSTDN